MRPKRTDDKYWTGTRNFNHIQYEIDLEDYIIDLEAETEQLRLGGVPDTLPADELIKSLGEAKEPNEYILKTDNGVWWIEHKHVGSGELLKQWLTEKSISG